MKRVLVGLAVLLFVVLGYRVYRSAAATETGIELLRVQWKEATSGWLFKRSIPIHTEDPTVQAKFWLDEIDRILALPPGNPDHVMAAAMILDNPSSGFVARYTSFERWPNSQHVSIEMDTDRVTAQTIEFEKLCRERCLELAAQATQLDPNRLELWQFRCAMLWQHSGLAKIDPEVRTDDWEAVLEEAARHDPDNALYDYLAAVHLWDLGAELEYYDGRYVVAMKSEADFDRGVRYFEQGLAKPMYGTSRDNLSLVARFLEQSTLPKNEQIEITASRNLDLSRSTFFRELSRWQYARANMLAQQGEVRKALQFNRDVLRVADQYAQFYPNSLNDIFLWFFLETTAASINKLMEDYPTEFDHSESEEIKNFQNELEAARNAIQLAGEQLQNKKVQARDQIIGLGKNGRALATIVVGEAPVLIVFMLVISLLSAPFTLGMGKSPKLVRETIQTFSLLVLAFAITFAVLGLSSSESRAAFFPSRIDDYGIESSTYLSLATDSIDSTNRWTEVLIRWWFYYGSYWTIGLWMILTGCLVGWKNRSIRSYLRLTRRSFLGLTFVLGLTYLLLVPDVVAENEFDFRARIDYQRNPELHLQELGEEVRKLSPNRTLPTLNFLESLGEL